MDSFCRACADVSNNLHSILTSDIDFRTGSSKTEYVWKTDIASVVRAGSRGCSFCHFVDYVLLKPYYDPQSLGSVSWRTASAVEGLSDEQFALCVSHDVEGSTSCCVCSSRTFKGDQGLCYLCRPRIARYLANHSTSSPASAVSGMLPMSITIRKATWELDENNDVEGLALKGYIEASGRHALNTNEQLFRIDCAGDDPAAEFVPQRPRLSNFNSPQIFVQVRSLLKTCAEEHDCGPESPVNTATRPTRLIDLGSEGSNDPVRLVNGATSEPYVALSYCWGGRQSLVTKKTTLEPYQKEIPVSELAQSIQDAICLTRKLGLRLLWVDALCIVQDDKQDKSREIGKMRNVYANSYLTILAGRAKAAVDGFLSTRTKPFTMDSDAIAADLTDDYSSQAAKDQSRHPEDVSGTLPVASPEVATGEVTIRRRIEYSSATEPLVARAWTYEERLLSKRIITFGQCITWRCLDSHCLFGDTGDHWYPTDEENVSSVRGEPHTIALQPKKLLRRWHDLVTAYSTRSMYNETDKLPAIAGIVQQIQPDGDVQAYMAGLWRSQLAGDLMWCLPRYGTKPTVWQAPSWSWASLNGLVRFQNAVDMVQGENILVEDVVYDVEVDSELNPFGQLRSAKMEVTGRIGVAERGLVAWKSPHGSTASTAFEEILCDSNDPSTVTYEGTSRLKIDVEDAALYRLEDEYPDYPVGIATLIRSEPVWCLPLHGIVDFELGDSWADDRFETRMDGLLLRKNEDGSYRRIGVFEVAKYDDGRYFSWSQPERIHLK